LDSASPKNDKIDQLAYLSPSTNACKVKKNCLADEEHHKVRA